MTKNKNIISSVLLFLTILIAFLAITPTLSFASENYCLNRGDKCPVSSYPTCEKNQSCGEPACVVKTVFENDEYWFYCAYPNSSQPTITPIPTLPTVCGRAGSTYNTCCTSASSDSVCYTGKPSWKAGNCTCVAAAPTTAPPSDPGPFNSEKINFSQLGKAIPGLNSIFFTENAPTNVGAIINALLPFLFIIAGLLLLFYLIAGGFQLMTSANNEKGVAAAKAKITSAVIGFFLLFVSFWLVQIVEIIFGITIF